ncbi:ATP-grasp fold amidoligase family protein [Clostridium perfringens]|nr:glycosyl transferase [Clostridium perfringens]MDK0577458.1 ATP-grasp fold amidoligase family protein [Clostridium perfringens]MDK0580400.1 ATP-grasp fold amidoligase family protein [Clostridium perfringens]
MKRKKIINKLKKVLFDKDYRFLFMSGFGLFNSMSDEEYLKRKYHALMGYELNLNNPQTFNEKLQWLKLYNRQPEYTMMVDKYLVRQYISDKLGEEYLIPIIGVWDNPDEIDFEKLPNKFVLKCNHNSGLGMCICKDKTKLNIRKVKKELKKGLKQDYYMAHREWPYKDVPRKIVAEKYMVEKNSTELKDYKLMCFNGKVKCSFVCSDRFSDEGIKVTFFDINWNVMPFERHYPKSDETITKPVNYEKMIEFAEILSKGIPFLRVDFYEIEGKLYFGELTFFPGSGFEEFTPEQVDYDIGKLINL